MKQGEEIVKTATEVALEKGYLENKVIFIKPVPRQGKMISDPKHVGFFMYDDAYAAYTLPVSKRGELTNIFKDDDERAYFEKALDLNLNVHSDNSKFWNSKEARVKFTKTTTTMKDGERYDLSKPMDNIRYRIWKAQPSTAPSWDLRTSKPFYKFAIVDENYEVELGNEQVNKMAKIWMHFGSIQNNAKKMTEFLDVYFATYQSQKIVPEVVEKDFLIAEINKIITSEKDRYLNVINDENYDIKVFIIKAIKVGSIAKDGVNKYNVIGEGTTFDYKTLINYLSNAKKLQEDVYFKIEAQIKQAKL